MLSRLKLNFDRSFSGSVGGQVLWILVLVFMVYLALALFLSLYEGFSAKGVLGVFVDMISPVSLRDSVYKSSSVDWSLFFRLFVVYFIGLILLSGTLIATLSNILRTRSEAYKQGSVFYKFKNHFLVLGTSESVPFLVKSLLEKGECEDSLVLLQTSGQAEKVRSGILALLNDKQAKRFVVVRANRNSTADLLKLRVAFAKGVYIIGDIGEDDRDMTNLDCFRKISDICKTRKEKLDCYVQIEERSSFILSRTSNCISERDAGGAEMHLLNFEEAWARKVFVECESAKHGFAYLPLDRGGIAADSEKRVHLIVLGMTDMGLALAVTAAQICHFPNYVTNGLKTKITFVDEDAYIKMSDLIVRYNSLFKHSCYSYRVYEEGCFVDERHFEFSPKDDFVDIEWEFVQTDVNDEMFRTELSNCASDKNSELTLAVCFDSMEKNRKVAFYLPDSLYSNDCVILMRQKSSLFVDQTKFASRYKNVFVFGMEDEGDEQNENLLLWAKRINYLYYDSNFETVAFPGDEVERRWNELSVVKKWSNLYSAMTVGVFLRSLGMSDFVNEISEKIVLSEHQIKLMGEVEHNRWNVEEMLLGFRPTTEEENAQIEKDPELKGFFKNMYAHYDICSSYNLKSREIDVSLYDEKKIVSLLNIVRG